MQSTTKPSSLGDAKAPFRIDSRIYVAVTLVLAVAVGFLLADHYGVSTDEQSNIMVGEDALRAFTDPPKYEDYLDHGARLAHHGPSYFMVYYLGAGAFSDLFPNWNFSAGRHLTNYLTYLVGLGAFYAVARRFLDPTYALLTTIFFGTQPLLFGHAFVNQKDTPFLAFFAATIASGMWAVDRLRSDPAKVTSGTEKAEWPEVGVSIRDDLGRRSKRQLALAALATLLLGTLVIDVLFLELGLQTAKDLLTLAHQGTAPSPIPELYRRIAEDAFKTPVTVYQAKLTLLYWIIRPVLLLGAGLSGVLIARWILPSLTKPRWARYRRALLPLLLAGILLGWTISIRPIGAYAGALVALYWIRRERLGSLDLMIIYGLLAAGVTYLTWPYLWEAPVSRFVESVRFTGGFAKISEYFGSIVRANDLPWHYFPTFVLITLTEPLVPLFLIGLLVMGFSRPRWRGRGTETVILALWIAGPLFALIALNMGVYGNIRHLHFVLAPLFIVAGVGLQWVLPVARRWWIRWAMAALVLAPAIVGIIRLHPYEYSYYNSFIGGPAGASAGFTHDRWCISYRAAMDYVNKRANPGDSVVAIYSPSSALPFAADGVEVEFWSREALAEARFILTCSLNLGEYRESEEWKLVYSVRRAGATFAEVFEKVPVTD